jgi:hypothetical protein
MHKYSKRAKLIHNIFMMLVLLDHEEGNHLIDSAMGFPTIPTLGSMAYPKQLTCQLIFNMVFEYKAQLSKFLGVLLSQRYLGECLPGRNQDEYNLLVLFQMRNEDFRQAVPPVALFFFHPKWKILCSHHPFGMDDTGS